MTNNKPERRENDAKKIKDIQTTRNGRKNGVPCMRQPTASKTGSWDWMEEIDIFGVKDPESGEIGFVEHHGLVG
ncbi:MAG: hypothetical protein M5U34_26470 [Chloroflexi bacterium]|nr:hypothetical protein [Chloroflexota bacterium]